MSEDSKPNLPTPRSCRYFGMTCEPSTGAEGTWLEPEELCYPDGGRHRRCYAICADGVKRVVWCAVPDTYTTIPARCKAHGRWVYGFVTMRDGAYYFTPFDKANQRRS